MAIRRFARRPFRRARPFQRVSNTITQRNFFQSADVFTDTVPDEFVLTSVDDWQPSTTGVSRQTAIIRSIKVRVLWTTIQTLLADINAGRVTWTWQLYIVDANQPAPAAGELVTAAWRNNEKIFREGLRGYTLGNDNAAAGGAAYFAPGMPLDLSVKGPIRITSDEFLIFAQEAIATDTNATVSIQTDILSIVRISIP